jgi:GNAT superfamily N-acetyltransferase
LGRGAAQAENGVSQPVRIRELAAHEWPLFRALRLRALADAPEAFATPFAEAASRTELQWREQLAGVCASPSHVLFVAESGATAHGLVFGRLDADSPLAHLGAMWVAPETRLRGAGRLLVDAVAEWARALGAVAVELQVTEGNEPAERLYAAAGFARTERSEPHPSQPGLRVRTLRLALESP